MFRNFKAKDDSWNEVYKKRNFWYSFLVSPNFLLVSIFYIKVYNRKKKKKKLKKCGIRIRRPKDN